MITHGEGKSGIIEGGRGIGHFPDSKDGMAISHGHDMLKPHGDL
jgi:hypothetical protein